MSPKAETYNGWANWETWNVALWLNNDEQTYRKMRSLRPFTPQKAKIVVRHLFPSGTPDMRPGGRFPYYQFVDWQEIAADFNEE